MSPPLDPLGLLHLVLVGMLVAAAVRPRRWPGALLGLLCDPTTPRARAFERPSTVSPSWHRRSARRSVAAQRRVRRDRSPSPTGAPARTVPGGFDGQGVIVNSLDLLAVALSSGASLHRALLDVAEFGGAAEPLASSAARLQRGVPLLDVLDAIPDELGTDWMPVATTLAVTATSGAPAIDAVRRLGTGLRVRRRRQCEQRIRRLPVLLLLPLAVLMLPAFVLVTFVPVAVAIGGRSGL